MKCAFHTDLDATGQCVDCGKALCQQCTNLYKPVLCSDCAKVRSNKQLQKAVGALCISIILFVVSIIINKTPGSPYYPMSKNFGQLIFTSLFLAGIPWGWITLNKITSQLFLSLPVVGWLIYLIIKLMLSAAIGMFVMFIQIGIYIYKIIRHIKLQKQIKININNQN